MVKEGKRDISRKWERKQAKTTATPRQRVDMKEKKPNRDEEKREQQCQQESCRVCMSKKQTNKHKKVEKWWLRRHLTVSEVNYVYTEEKKNKQQQKWRTDMETPPSTIYGA